MGKNPPGCGPTQWGDKKMKINDRSEKAKAITSKLISQADKEICAGHYGKAKECCKKALKYCKNNARIFMLMGEAFYQVKEIKKAGACFKKATNLDAKDSLCWQWLGKYYRKVGNLPEAVRAFKRSVKICPNDPWSHAYLGSTLWSQGKLRQAGEHYLDAVVHSGGADDFSRWNDEFLVATCGNAEDKVAPVTAKDRVKTMQETRKRKK